MNTFIKDNWFKIVIAVVVVFIGISAFYYFVILASQKETRIAEKARSDLIEKNRLVEEKATQEAEKDAQAELEAQQKAIEDKKKTDFNAWVNKCITDAYAELKTLQGNQLELAKIGCANGNCDMTFWNKAQDESFQEYQNEWVPQCKLGNRVFIHYEPMQ